MKYTDVCVGAMSPEQIGKEIKHYLTSCKKPSNLRVNIKRLSNGKFYTEIFMLTEDFKRKGCDGKKLNEMCPICFELLTDVFVY